MAPAAGALWLKRATLLRDLAGASEAFYSALLNSYQTARRSLPLSPARLALSLPYWEGLPQQLRAEVTGEAVRELGTALNSVAVTYVRHPDQRATIDKGMADLAPEPLREAFAKAVKVQGDRLRRNIDRIEANRRLASCHLECNATATLTLDVVGETFSEPPQFRVWVDGYPSPPTSVTSAVNVESGTRLWSDPLLSLNAQRFVFEVPAMLAVLEIEFINDDWDPARSLDRNLGLVKARIDDEEVRLSCFRVPEAYQDSVVLSDELLTYFRNGAARLDLDCDGADAP